MGIVVGNNHYLSYPLITSHKMSLFCWIFNDFIVNQLIINAHIFSVKWGTTGVKSLFLQGPKSLLDIHINIAQMC